MTEKARTLNRQPPVMFASTPQSYGSTGGTESGVP